MSENDYISGQEAADILQVSERTVQRYATGSDRRIRSRKYTGSKKLYYLRSDVEALASELGLARTAETVSRPKAEMMPAGEMLNYLRERDQELKEAQRALAAAMAEIGQGRAQLEQRRLLESRYDEVTTERDTLKQEIGRLRGHRLAAIVVIIMLLAFVAVLAFLLYGRA